jgi:hypothetical protein
MAFIISIMSIAIISSRSFSGDKSSTCQQNLCPLELVSRVVACMDNKFKRTICGHELKLRQETP